MKFVTTNNSEQILFGKELGVNGDIVIMANNATTGTTWTIRNDNAASVTSDYFINLKRREHTNTYQYMVAAFQEKSNGNNFLLGSLCGKQGSSAWGALSGKLYDESSGYYSIYCAGQGRINGHLYYASASAWSDRRVKENIVNEDTKNCLERVNKIKVKTYNYNKHYRETLNRPNGPVRGVIAQEILEIPGLEYCVKIENCENVFSENEHFSIHDNSIISNELENVTINKENPILIPINISEMLELSKIYIYSESEHNLKLHFELQDNTGDVIQAMDVELVIDNGIWMTVRDLSGINLQDININYTLKIYSNNDFITKKNADGLLIQLYGKKMINIKDFHSVDKNKIFMEGIGAIQELSKEVDTLKTQLADALTRLAALEQ